MAQLVHMAPPASQLPILLQDLLNWLANTDAHPLIASSALHYELEFIHPFSKGNGRVGQLWQTLILSRWQPVLAYLPVETVIKGRQADYYKALGAADAAADCSSFILFMLDALMQALQQAITQETTQEKIIFLIKRDPRVMQKQLAAQLSLTTDGVKYHPQKLKAAGRIEHVDSTKAGFWSIR